MVAAGWPSFSWLTKQRKVFYTSICIYTIDVCGEGYKSSLVLDFPLPVYHTHTHTHIMCVCETDSQASFSLLKEKKKAVLTNSNAMVNQHTEKMVVSISFLGGGEGGASTMSRKLPRKGLFSPPPSEASLS